MQLYTRNAKNYIMSNLNSILIGNCSSCGKPVYKCDKGFIVLFENKELLFCDRCCLEVIDGKAVIARSSVLFQ